MIARQLTDEAELRLVRRLLHDVYIHELGWVVPQPNPSGIQTSTDHAGNVEFRDRFESNAVVFGVFEEEDLIGTIRLMKPFEGKLELENYRKIPQKLIGNNPRKYEVNRMAIRKQWQNSVALVHLLRAVGEYLAHSDCEILFAALAEPEPANFCLKLGFLQSESDVFRYHSSEKSHVRLHHLDCRNRQSVERIISLCTRIIDS